MKDVFASRCVSDFHALFVDFADSLHESLPDVKEWHASVTNASPDDLIRKWSDAVVTPMGRQHAKYARAIMSITGTSAVVYHAISYRDATAVCACCDPLSPLSTSEVVKTLKESDVPIFWKYMLTLSETCYRWTQSSLPRVPTSDEIRADIDARRAGGGGGVQAAQGLTSGVDDLWTQLCRKRGVSVPITDAIRDQIRSCVRGEVTDESLRASFPDLQGGVHARPDRSCGLDDESGSHGRRYPVRHDEGDRGDGEQARQRHQLEK